MQMPRLHRLSALAASLTALAFASPLSAQGTACVLEYRRADNMWAGWGRPDGLLGTETITLQPGQRKVFVTDWSYEKQRNDGTNFYGSHLRRAVNRGAGPLQIKARGPGSFVAFIRAAATPLVTNTLNSSLVSTTAGALVKLIVGSPATLQAGDSALFRHDLTEVSCPAATTVVTSVAPPPAPPVVLSLTGARTTTNGTVTVTANDAASGAALVGRVTINGVSGAVGQAITFAPCYETFDIEDTRGLTRSRTVRVPCEGVVQISGYQDSYFNF